MTNEEITEIPRQDLPEGIKRWYEIMCRFRKIELFFQEMNAEGAPDFTYCRENIDDFYIMLKSVFEEFEKYAKEKCQKEKK